MKTLLLLRHAKPNPLKTGESDFDRPLIEEGRSDARLIGQTLLRKKLAPDVILSSPAARARETIDIVHQAAQLSVKTRFDESLFNADAEHILGVIAEVESDPATLLVVAHNPGVAGLISLLTGKSVPVHPGTLSRIDLDIEKWSDLRGDSTGQLAFSLKPGEK